jgi:hypothetical protein
MSMNIIGNIIGDGSSGHVYSYGKDYILKVTYDTSEGLIAETLLGTELEHIAEYRGATKVHGTGETIIIKERIQEYPGKIYADISRLVKHWDDSLIHTSDLFDYFNECLKTGKKSVMEYRATNKFIDYISTIEDKKEFVEVSHLFVQLVSIVTELHYLGIYNVDWNEENFGHKNKRLALFELGGAKIKKNKNYDI